MFVSIVKYASCFFLFTTFSLQATLFSTIKFERYNVEDGLSQSSISSIHQDNNGFMWFGTESGLNRFDGYEFVSFNPTQGNIIKAINSDREGNLWFGNSSGLHLIPSKQEHISTFTSDNMKALTNDSITDIEVSLSGKIWIGTEGGLFLLETQKGINNVSVKPIEITTKPINITSIEEVRPHILWVSSRNELIEVDTINNTTKAIGLSKNSSAIGIMEILKSSAGDIWLATYYSGIFRYNSDGELIAHYTTNTTTSIPDNSVYAIAEDNKGRLWFGLTNNGVTILENGNFSILQHEVNNPTSLSSNAIESLFSDRHGNVWVGTNRMGLNKHRAITETFTHIKRSASVPYDNLPQDIRTLFVDQFDNLWVGSAEHTLSLVNQELTDIKKLLFSPEVETNIYHMIKAEDDSIWAATFDGLLKLSSSPVAVEAYYNRENSNLEHGRTFHIADDTKGNVWISHWGLGLSKFNKITKEVTFYNELNSNLPSNSVIGMALSPSGNLWLISDAGLAEYKAKADAFESYTHYAHGKGHEFESITMEADGLMWLPSMTGLHAFDTNTKSFLSLALPKPLINEVVYDLIKDDQDFYWASTNNGLIRFKKNEKQFVHFKTKDGLQSREFNGGAAAKFSNGNIAFGGVNGINVFNPSSINSLPASARITGINVTETKTNRRYVNDIPNQLTLSPNTLNVLITISAMNYAHPEDTKYRYRLKEVDDHWSQTKGNSITLGQLASGSYELQIQATNTFGQWQSEPISLNLNFVPPWYKQRLAYFLYILLFLFLIYAFFRGKLARIQAHSSKLESLVKQRTKELFDRNLKIENQARELHLAIEEKTRLYETISHELRTPITLILGPIRQLTSQITKPDLQDTAQLIERNANRLNRLVNQLLDLSRSDIQNEDNTGPTDICLRSKYLVNSFQPYANELGIELIYQSCDQAFVYLHKNEVEKIISNLVSNAIKYSSPDSSVKLEIGKDDRSAIIRISDTGIGISDEQIPRIFNRFYRVQSDRTNIIEGSGLGLSIVKSIVESASGVISVQSKLGEGTKFEISLPLVLSDDLQQFNPNRGSKYSTISHTKLNAALPHLLLIDDNDDMLLYVSSLLSKSYRVSTASNGEEGIELTRNTIPDIIVCDVMMPKVDGLAFLENIKNNVLTNHIPIILLTANGSEKSRLKALSMQADDYIAKPFNDTELLYRLRNLLDARDILKKKFSAELLHSSPDLKPTTPEFLVKLDKIIELNYQRSSFSVSELAKEAAFSERQLLRKLKATMDVTAKEYIRTFRLKKAALLLDDNCVVSSVADKVGFSSSAYFSNCFKAYYGQSPTQYVNSRKLQVKQFREH